MSRRSRPLQNVAPGISGAEAYWAIDAAEPKWAAAVGRAAQLAGDPARRRRPRAKNLATGARAELRPLLARLPAGIWVRAENLLWWS
jgi:hypothetical protein